MNKPNIFKFATKELSQDAFICWLLAWADKAHQGDELHDVGVHFLKSLLAKKSLNSVQINSFEIKQQYKRIDILVLINTNIKELKSKKQPTKLPEDSLAIIIEDKVKANQHGNQLQNYDEEIQKLGFKEGQILKIYLKTTDQSNFKKIEDAGYIPFDRDDFLNVLNSYSHYGQNQILLDFRSFWQDVDTRTKSFQVSALKNWESSAWTGFYKALSKSFVGGSFSKNSFGSKSSPTYAGFIWLQKNDCILYVQLCKDRLNFKICNISQEQSNKTLRIKWTKLLCEQDFGVSVKVKMSNPRSGKAMVVGYLEGYIMNDWDKLILNSDDDFVSVTKTVERLKSIEEIISALEVDK